jgi:hypothetical protein
MIDHSPAVRRERLLLRAGCGGRFGVARASGCRADFVINRSARKTSDTRSVRQSRVVLAPVGTGVLDLTFVTCLA